MNAATAHSHRARWNSAINATLLSHCESLKLLQRGQSIAALPDHIRDPLTKRWKALLEWACTQDEGHRRATSIERELTAALWRALRPFSPLTFGTQQELEFDPYATPESTRRWAAADFTTTREKR